MFTVEIKYDHELLTVLDDEAEFDDLSVEFYEDVVLFKQWDEEIDDYHIILISPKMFSEIILSLQQSEGLYKL
jgi:hypothetical protein